MQIFEVVATSKIRALATEEEKGFRTTVFDPESVGPKREFNYV